MPIAKSKAILGRAREILKEESLALDWTLKALGEGFVRAVDLMLRSKGKVVVTGARSGR